MSNLEHADARTAFLTTVRSRHSLPSAERVSLGQILRRPSRNINKQDLFGHRRSAGASKRQMRQIGKSPFASWGRTIYNAKPEASSPKASIVSKSIKSTIPSCDLLHVSHALYEQNLTTLEILQRMDAEEKNREKYPFRRFAMEASNDCGQRYWVDDEDKFGRMVGCGTSDWDHSGDGEWRAMFKMYIKEDQCLEEGGHP